MVTETLVETDERQPKTSPFIRSFIAAAVIEAVIIGGLLYAGSIIPPPRDVIQKKKVIAIHMVQPIPPQPKPIPVPPPPKPVVQPKPKPVLVPIPIPIPIPKPVVHHTPPKPLLAKAPTAPVYTPPVVKPSAPPPAPSPAMQQNAIDSYAAMLRTRVQADTRVPEAVRLMHTSGTAVVAFRLTPAGRLLSAHVAQGSGVGPIDRAALKAVENGYYPPFTKKMPKHDMTFDVRVHLSAHTG